ncbi:MAG: WD40/YVTN/BNR-like repeat-containing protein [Moorellales bacterium]
MAARGLRWLLFTTVLLLLVPVAAARAADPWAPLEVSDIERVDFARSDVEFRPPFPDLEEDREKIKRLLELYGQALTGLGPESTLAEELGENQPALWFLDRVRLTLRDGRRITLIFYQGVIICPEDGDRCRRVSDPRVSRELEALARSYFVRAGGVQVSSRELRMGQQVTVSSDVAWAKEAHILIMPSYSPMTIPSAPYPYPVPEAILIATVPVEHDRFTYTFTLTETLGTKLDGSPGRLAPGEWLLVVQAGRQDMLPVSILPRAAAQPQAPLTRLLPAGFEVKWRAGMVKGRGVGEVLLALPGEEGQVLFRLREGAGGLSPARRAQIVAGRLQSLLDRGLTAGEIAVARRQGDWVVVARDQVLAMADVRTARLSNSHPQALAYRWAQNLINALAQRDRPAKSGRTMDLVLDPAARGTVYALTGEGVQKSSDGGRTWQLLPIPYTEGRPEAPAPFPQSLTLLPGDPRRLLVGIYPGEIWLSEDGGATWEKTWADAPGSGGNARVYALEADPQVPDRAWVGLADGLDRGYVLRSDDGGRTWQRVWQGGGVMDLLPVPGHEGAVLIQVMEANPETDGGWEPVVYRSGDGGINWERLGFGGILTRDSSAPGVVYRTEWRLEKLGDRYLKTGYRLKRSSDGGATWEEVACSGVPEEPWLFVPVTVEGQPRLLIKGDRSYYYRRWTLAPLPEGFAERRRQLEALVTEALSWCGRRCELYLRSGRKCPLRERF